MAEFPKDWTDDEIEVFGARLFAEGKKAIADWFPEDGSISEEQANELHRMGILLFNLFSQNIPPDADKTADDFDELMKYTLAAAFNFGRLQANVGGET